MIDNGAATATVTILNKRGLHARAAARFVETVGAFDAEVSVTCQATTVSGSSIMGLMMLAAGPGTRLDIDAVGVDADAVLAALVKLIADRFGED